MKSLRYVLAGMVLLLSAKPALRAAAPADSVPLQLVNTIKLPAAVKGHFDHFGIDVPGDRLFATAEGYKSVLVLDIKSGKLIHTIGEIGVPHAILYRPDINRLFITDGGEGAVKIFDSQSYALVKTVKLKLDTDSICYDSIKRFLWVVNGGGDAHETFSTLSVIDTDAGAKLGEMQIDGDTLEAMAIEISTSRLYVNNRAKNQVEVIDRYKRKPIATWPITLGKVNVAMAFDEPSHRLFVGCRSGKIVVVDTGSGKELQALDIEQGVDDMVYEPTSKRLYAACGAGNGAVHVFKMTGLDQFESLGSVTTGPAAKTGLLAPGLGRYFVAAPADAENPARILVYRVL